MIAREDLKFYRSAVVNDGNTNGGRMGNTLIVSSLAANLFPITSESDRAAGTSKYRKAFVKNANEANGILYNARVFLDRYTPGEDIITFFPATQDDTQGEIGTPAQQYGAGKLNASVSAGDTVLEILLEDTDTAQVFADGMEIHVSDKTNIDDPTNEEFATVSGAPAVASGNIVTLTLAAPLQNGYSESNTRVSSVLPAMDIAPSHSDEVVTSAGSGDYDFAHLTGNNVGSIEQTWTITFSGSAAFNVSGDTVGDVGGGNVSGGVAPNNAAFGAPFFTLAATGFSGVWAADDTIIFKTHPAAVPLWVQRVVPAGSAANANNAATLSVKGETA
jgi:hypothetical protein